MRNVRPRSARPHLSSDESLEAQVGRRIHPQPNGCWLWDGQTERYGHVIVTISGERSQVHAHRWVYETLVGPIPKNHQLHHECETKGCVNPAHLVPLLPAAHYRQHAVLKGTRRPSRFSAA